MYSRYIGPQVPVSGDYFKATVYTIKAQLGVSPMVEGLGAFGVKAWGVWALG